MSRTHAALLLVLCLALALPVPALPQSVEELRARLERLTAMHEQALRAEAAEEGRIELVRVGPLTAYAQAENAAAARALLDSAWVALVSRLRSGVSVVPERSYRYDIDPALRTDVSGLDVSSVAEVVRDVHKVLKRRIDSTGTYLDELPFEPLDPTRRAGVYVDLVTASSSSARSCYLGDIAACRDALGLERPDDISARPLEENARRLLVEVAVELGGEGAYRRLLAPGTAGLDARLAAAAGVEIDSVVAAWRGRLFQAVVHRSPAVDPISGVASLGWIALFLFLASWSSRWRLD